MSEGWIKLHRVLKDKPIWKKSTPEHKAILVTLLMIANHKPNEWEWQGEKFKVKPGQVVTSIDGIKAEAGKGISTQNVRSALNRFESLGFLTNKSTKTGRLITIVNWELYQSINTESNKDTNKELTKNQQRGNKEVTPNKNDKNDKNDKTNNYPAEFEDFWGVYPRRKEKQAAYRKWAARTKEGYYPDCLVTAAKNYKKECERSKTEERYMKHPATFLGPDKPFQEYMQKEEEKTKPKKLQRVIKADKGSGEIISVEDV